MITKLLSMIKLHRDLPTDRFPEIEVTYEICSKSSPVSSVPVVTVVCPRSPRTPRTPPK